MLVVFVIIFMLHVNKDERKRILIGHLFRKAFICCEQKEAGQEFSTRRRSGFFAHPVNKWILYAIHSFLSLPFFFSIMSYRPDDSRSSKT